EAPAPLEDDAGTTPNLRPALGGMLVDARPAPERRDGCCIATSSTPATAPTKARPYTRCCSSRERSPLHRTQEVAGSSPASSTFESRLQRCSLRGRSRHGGYRAPWARASAERQYGIIW